MERDEREAAELIDSLLIEEGNRHTPAQQMKGQEGTPSPCQPGRGTVTVLGGGSQTLQHEILLITAIKPTHSTRSPARGQVCSSDHQHLILYTSAGHQQTDMTLTPAASTADGRAARHHIK